MTENDLAYKCKLTFTANIDGFLSQPKVFEYIVMTITLENWYYEMNWLQKIIIVLVC